MIKIQIAKIEHAAELSTLLAKVWRVAYQGIFPQSFLDNIQTDGWTEGLRKSIADRNVTLLVAQKEEQIVGMISFGPARDTELNIRNEIYAINVLPEFQQQKIGEQLLQAALTTEALKDKPVYLRVAKENHTAQHFYLKHGFTNSKIEKIRQIADFSFAEWVYCL